MRSPRADQLDDYKAFKLAIQESRMTEKVRDRTQALGSIVITRDNGIGRPGMISEDETSNETPEVLDPRRESVQTNTHLSTRALVDGTEDQGL